MIRPEPSGVRRKSMSRSEERESPGRDSANEVAEEGDAPVLVAPDSVTNTDLPSTFVSNAPGDFRFSTMRERSPTCTTLMLRKSPCPTSWLLRPSAFTVLGKSKATRGGLATAKPAGAAAGASLRLILRTTAPPCWVTFSDSIAFCAHTELAANASATAM